MIDDGEDRFQEQLVTFSFKHQGRTVIVENVPARVDTEAGEEFFSPETVEQLQAIVRDGLNADPVAKTQVFQFAG
jgi:YgiT-type zinc finger domain-containing protein